MKDTRYLTTRGRMYWVQIAAPRALWGRARRLVQKSLSTSSLQEAQSLRWAWVNGYKAAWQAAKTDPKMTAEEIDALAEREQARLAAIEKPPAS